MRRRDIAKALLASASPTLLAGPAGPEAGIPVHPVRVTDDIAAGLVSPNGAMASPVGHDVRRHGATGRGSTDDRDAIGRATTTGSAVYFPRGIYRIGSDLTITVPCVFDYGAILKPDAGVSVTLGSLRHRVFLSAGPWLLFDLSNPGSAITGACANNEVFAEWFGAAGDGRTDDGPALQRALNFCMSSGYVPLQLMAKHYVTRQPLWATSNAGWAYDSRPRGAVPDNNGVPIHGIRNSVYLGSKSPDNVQGSTISVPSGSWRHAYGLPILSYIGNCFDANLFGEKVRDVHFRGDSSCVGVMVAGANGLRIRDCSFDGTLAAGLRWENGLYPRCYTEYAIAENCWFGYHLGLAAHYSGPSGSMHGSGLASRCLINRTDESPVAIRIDGGVQPYNAVLDIQVWHSNRERPCTVLDCKNPRWLPTFFGHITLEAQEPQQFHLGAERDCAFAGTVTALQNSLVHAGSCVIARGALSLDGQGIVPVFPNRGNAQAIGPGTTVLRSHDLIAQQVRFVCIKIVAEGYRYCQILAVSPGNAVKVIAILDAVDTSGYGPPVFGLNGPNLTATNASYPPAGMTAYWADQCLDALPSESSPIRI